MYLSIKRPIRSQVRLCLSLRRFNTLNHSWHTLSLKAPIAALFMGTP